MTPFSAHAGHWAVSLVYAAPVLILAGVILVDMYKRRNEDPDDPATPEDPGTDA